MPDQPPRLQPPESGVTPETLLARAAALRPMLRETQDECESLRRLPDATHRAFRQAGLYRILQPERFGGYECDLTDFLRVVIEVARGCPSCGWVLAFMAGHTHTLASFPLDVQSAIYGTNGDAFVPFTANPGGTATPTGEGYTVNGKWDYASGCDLGERALCAAVAPHPKSGEPTMALVLLHPGEFTIVDNWQSMGLRGTGSKRIVVDSVTVPAERVIADRASLSRDVYPNPFYVGPLVSLLMSEIAAVAVGIGWAALDEYEELMRARRIANRPFSLRFEHHEYQQHFGHVWALLETAEAALLDAGRRYMDWARRDVGAEPFDEVRDTRLHLVEQQVVRLAAEALDVMARSAGTRALKPGKKLERYVRDMAELRTHGGMQAERLMERFARIHFGLPAIPGAIPDGASPFEPPPRTD
jgi:3-hydroxy-9,10-secoandrosta-1,3,5(10)-triene-9,17-dione monooxygenase